MRGNKDHSQLQTLFKGIYMGSPDADGTLVKQAPNEVGRLLPKVLQRKQ